MSATKRNGRVTPSEPKTPPKPKDPTAGTLGVLKVLVQPVFVLVGPEGDVREVQHGVLEIKGPDWPAWLEQNRFDTAQCEQIRQGLTVQQV
jgi:hypothetical protein